MQKHKMQPTQPLGHGEQVEQREQLEQLWRQRRMQETRLQGGRDKTDGPELPTVDPEEPEEPDEVTEDFVLRGTHKATAEPAQDTARKTPGRITRVVADLMIFVEVEESGDRVGLVFKPDKIRNYRGEPLKQLGIRVGAPVSEIQWDVETLKVSSVVLSTRTGTHSPPIPAVR